VLKPTSPSIFELYQELKDTFGQNPQIRSHIDDNQDELVLVFVTDASNEAWGPVPPKGPAMKL